MSWSIKIENLGKKYRVGQVHQLSLSFRESFSFWIRNASLWKRARSETKSEANGGILSSSEFWALRSINLEVQQGEVVGIIGRNGAGKSTLLKILSRITPPTSGRIQYRGRVSALLEVGTGFHRELTGRENIFLNGAILGMRRNEIAAKLDEIVAFSGVEKFLDTPVKFYSSGMYIRLAFAVAAHLQSDILVVDEVLAVGDSSFQQKCIGKMRDIASQAGRTVLFVSHNMDAVQKLCSRGVLLESGQIAFEGQTSMAVAQYLGKSELQVKRSFDGIKGRTGSGEARYKNVELLDGAGLTQCEYRFDSPMRFRATIEFLKPMENVVVGYNVFSSKNIALIDARSHYDGFQLGSCSGQKVIEVTIPALNFYPGIYTVYLWVSPYNKPVMDYIEDAFAFRLVPPPDFPKDQEFYDVWGAVHVSSQWKVVS